MNYQELLAAAQRNSEKQSALIRRCGQLNGLKRGPDPEAVARFKARKEREEEQRLLRALEEKQRLLSLRAQNSKSMRKAQMMKSRTKDNNFGCIVTTDHDRIIGEKIREKSINDTKERMKARIDLDRKLNGLSRKDRDKIMKRLEQEEPVKVESKMKKISDIIKQTKQKTNDPSRNEKKLKTPPPPPPQLSYDQLLNMAEEKSMKKISLEDEIKAELEFREKNMEKNRQELDAKERQRQIDYYRNDAKRPMEKTTMIDRGHSNNRMPTTKRMKTVIDQQSEMTNQGNPKRSINQVDRNLNRQQVGQQQKEPPSKSAQNLTKNTNGNRLVTKQRITVSSSSPSSSSTKNRNDGVKPDQKRFQQQQQHEQPIRTLSSANMFDPKPSLPLISSKQKTSSLSKSIPQKSSVISKTTLLSSSSSSSQQQRRQPMHNHQRQLPPPSRPKLPPIGATYRRGIYDDYQQNDHYNDDDDDDVDVDDDYDDNDEMDDEMADFIDDGPIEQPEPEEGYSRHIREIFGYDKRKYRNIIEDDIEEASYGQCLKEEMRSLREGIREDLEDIRREEQEKRLKALQKKARMKGLKGY
ncbi:hypothetical protein BLA29_003720 [Euroglyphus maynei]|uniref:Protein SPT2 homolog n=1 Tax=Euroglyphus maynei TaxID=6958 RepID=A0A1Y3AY79_EURMA|nr:hypothetical protein BLA29_003720 [Euroglyphus maynei]